MQGNKQKSKKKVWKALKAGIDSPIIIGLSAANSSMSGIINLIHMILNPMGVAGILLGNIAGSIFFNSISLILNTSFLVSCLREKTFCETKK